MQNVPTLVSVIIPAYNASAYIEETIQSIVSQSYQKWEIIVVNDGSTDKTTEIIGCFTDSRLKLVNQQNAGVAAARNKGLLQANGEFIVFFDSDDLMTPEFLSERVIALRGDASVGYVGGLVQTFPVKSKTKVAAAADPVNEILFFNSSFATVPSNYMFRTRMLTDNGIKFNEKLSSTADRFFILEVSRYAKGRNLKGEKGKLLYRFTSQSMSNNVTPKLIIDNERFFFELKKKNFLPDQERQKYASLYFFSLAMGFAMVRYWKRGIKYLVMSFIKDPVFFTQNCGRKIITFPFFRLRRMIG
jgi:glycosyltransferase involved in cell wall biosynthesis